MSAAVDRKEWIRLFTNDRAILATTLLPPGIDGRPENFQPKYGYDPARAKALLAKAGFPGGKGLKKLSFDLRGADSKSRQIGEFFISQWEKIGIPVEAIYNSFPAFLEKMKKANHQISYGGWAMDYPDLENAYQILYGKNAAPGPNESNFDDPRFNALYEKIAVMRPGPERSKLARQMEEIA
jgi:ABC-type transport system substrate-binding protein